MERPATDFRQDYNVNLALTRQQQETAHTIRHQVYAEELGWEPLNERRLETDSYDDYAIHCLVEHKRSGEIAGCVRLVLPQIGGPNAPLPCQAHRIPMRDDRPLAAYCDGLTGEISRLAVPGKYRRGRQQCGSSEHLESSSAIKVRSRREQTGFAQVALGLYLAAIAMVEISDLDRALVVMQPRLHRHLQRFGLFFHPISEHFDLHGQRALFYLPREELTINMEQPILELYRLIRHRLAPQYEAMPPASQEVFQHHDRV